VALRAVGIGPVVVPIVIVEVRSASVNVHNSVTRNTIAVHPWACNVNVRHKNPIVVRYVDIDIDVHAGA
jgi:hypothetical protein